MAFWLWIVVNVLSVVTGWSATATQPDMQQVLTRMPWFPYLVVGIVVALLAWLGIATARWASNVGRWIFVILAVLSVGLVAPGLAAGGVPVLLSDWLVVVAAVVAVAAAVLLFRPDAAAWFADTADIDQAPQP